MRRVSKEVKRRALAADAFAKRARRLRVDEDERDARIATLRLAQIASDPSRLVSGEDLERHEKPLNLYGHKPEDVLRRMMNIRAPSKAK